MVSVAMWLKCFKLGVGGFAPSLAEMTTCPICKCDIQDDELAFERSCGHTEHWRCARQYVPATCPQCRRAWTLLEENRRRCSSLLGLSPIEGRRARRLAHVDEASSSQHDAPAVPPSQNDTLAVPTDFVPQCCNHVGPPPRFETSPVRSMRYGGGGGVDEWHCYTCGRDVPRPNTCMWGSIVADCSTVSLQ